MNNPQLQHQSNSCFQTLEISDSTFNISLLKRPFKTNL